MTLPPARSSLSAAFTWSGAIMFVVALAAGAWFFGRRLAPLPTYPAMSVRIALANVLVFVVFALHHSVMARSSAKAWLLRFFPTAHERTLFVWVASLLFLGVCVAWQPTREVAWRLPATLAWVGLALQAMGLFVTALGARLIDIWELSGIRTPGGPLDPLTSRGPYGLVRHPIYSGWILMVWAAPVMSSGRLLFALLSTLYLVIAIPLEERSLEAVYGEAYRQYKALVRWRMVPGVY